MRKQSVNSKKTGCPVKTPANPNVPEKRERRWQVFNLSKEDHDNLVLLGPAIGCVDRYDALNKLAAVVKKMKAKDLNQPAKKYPLKLGIPPLLDVALHAKSEELQCTVVKVLLSAVRLMVEKANKKQKSKDGVKPPHGVSKERDAKPPRGVLEDAPAKPPHGSLKEDIIRALYLDDDDE